MNSGTNTATVPSFRATIGNSKQGTTETYCLETHRPSCRNPPPFTRNSGCLSRPRFPRRSNRDSKRPQSLTTPDHGRGKDLEIHVRVATSDFLCWKAWLLRAHQALMYLAEQMMCNQKIRPLPSIIDIDIKSRCLIQ